MKHVAQGTFLGGAGELGLGALPLADWRLDPVTKDVRSAVLFIPNKLLGIHKQAEHADVVAVLKPHFTPAERGGLPGVDYQIPLPLAGVDDTWDSVHIILGREAVAAAATFEGTPRVRAVPFPIGYSASPFPSGYQCSFIIRRKGDWQSLFLSAGFFEGGDPTFHPNNLKRGQILTQLNGQDMADTGVRELEHYDWIAFRNRDEKADIGAANKLLYMESSNFAFAEGGKTALLLLDADPLREAATIGDGARPSRWLRRQDTFRVTGKSLGYGGYALDGGGVEKTRGCILLGADEARLRKEIASGAHGQAEALLLPFRQQGVSGLHCKLDRRDAHWVLEDLGSTNGTWYHDGSDFVRVAAPLPVRRSCVLALGGLQSKLQVP